MTPLSIPDRLREFYRRLAAAPPVGSADAAFKLLCQILEDVEDELSGIPKQDPPPDVTMFDGRLYPPLSDNVRRLPDDGLIAKTRGHTILLGASGSISILRTVTGVLEFRKSGVNP